MQAPSSSFSAIANTAVLTVEVMPAPLSCAAARSSPKPPKAVARSARLEVADAREHTCRLPSTTSSFQFVADTVVSRCRVHRSLRSPIDNAAARLRQEVGAAMSRTRSALMQQQEEWRGRRRSSRQGPLTAVSDSGSRYLSQSLGNHRSDAPLKGCSIAPDVMQDDGELSCDSNDRSLTPYPFTQRLSPFLKRRWPGAATEYNACRLVEQRPHALIACPRDASSSVRLSGLEAFWCQAQISSDGS